ncbi:LppA family lipoprotein [Nocardia sp. NPDC052001]|uniref:LppA family lipoprotein n=1 Tax=Nocardia sp. NPDC052001 TaxID=3154853 RepID=UPI003428689C
MPWTTTRTRRPAIPKQRKPHRNSSPPPTLEDTQARVTRAVEDLAAYANSLVPGMTWTWTRTERQPRACDAPYDQTAGKRLDLPNYITEGGDPTHGGIPDAVWPQVRDKARQLAADLAATHSDPLPTAEKPGDRWRAATEVGR